MRLIAWKNLKGSPESDSFCTYPLPFLETRASGKAKHCSTAFPEGRSWHKVDRFPSKEKTLHFLSIR